MAIFRTIVQPSSRLSRSTPRNDSFDALLTVGLVVSGTGAFSDGPSRNPFRLTRFELGAAAPLRCWNPLFVALRPCSFPRSFWARFRTFRVGCSRQTRCNILRVLHCSEAPRDVGNCWQLRDFGIHHAEVAELADAPA
jgi:hypothetical protein